MQDTQAESELMRSFNEAHIIIEGVSCGDPIVFGRVKESQREAARYGQAPQICRRKTAVVIDDAGIAPGEEVILERASDYSIDAKTKRVDGVGAKQEGVAEAE